MIVENYRDFWFLVELDSMGEKPLRLKAESGIELNIWCTALTKAIKLSSTSDAVKLSLKRQSGYMLKEGKRVKNWKRRYFVVEDCQVKYYKNDAPNELLSLSRQDLLPFQALTLVEKEVDRFL